MEFKNWLFDEERFKGFKRMFQQQHPDMPKYVQNDLYNTRVGHAMNQNPGMQPSQIMSKAGFQNSQWGSPEVLRVSPSDFDYSTQEKFIHRRFGYREETQIRNDSQRTQTQRQISNYSVGKGTNEPVIMKQTSQGYQLLEGWHRTMSMLLRGCPEDQMNILKSGGGYDNDLDLTKWKKVPIKAYVTRGENVAPQLPGTGEYTAN